MACRYTLSILDWHEDGSASSAIWEITNAERDEIARALEYRSVTNGIITPEQAEQAAQAAQEWLAIKTQGI